MKPILNISDQAKIQKELSRTLPDNGAERFNRNNRNLRATSHDFVKKFCNQFLLYLETLTKWGMPGA
jgi:hypothetical protein